MVKDLSPKSEENVESNESGIDLLAYILEKKELIVSMVSPGEKDFPELLNTVSDVAKEYDVSNQYLVNLIYGDGVVDLKNFPDYLA